MSMNLNISCDGKGLCIRQTPTQISLMICVNDKGEIGKLRGKEARRALWSYCKWLQYLSNGLRWESGEELDEFMKGVNEDLIYLKPYLGSKKLKVWVS